MFFKLLYCLTWFILVNSAPIRINSNNSEQIEAIRTKRFIFDPAYVLDKLAEVADNIAVPLQQTLSLLSTTPQPAICYFREVRTNALEKYDRSKESEVTTTCGGTLKPCVFSENSFR